MARTKFAGSLYSDGDNDDDNITMYRGRGLASDWEECEARRETSPGVCHATGAGWCRGCTLRQVETWTWGVRQDMKHEQTPTLVWWCNIEIQSTGHSGEGIDSLKYYISFIILINVSSTFSHNLGFLICAPKK